MIARPTPPSLASRHAGWWAGLLILLILGIHAAGSRYMLASARSSMEAELQNHLEDLGRLGQTALRPAALGMVDRLIDAQWAAAMTSTASLTLDAMPDPDVAVYAAGLDNAWTAALERFAADARLEQLVLLDPEGRVLYDTLHTSRLLAPFEFWAIDGPEVAAALHGRAGASPAYRVDGAEYKRHYAPIAGVSGATAAVLCLVAGRDYLIRIALLARAIRRLNAMLAVLLALVGGIVYGLLRHQARMERRAADAERLAGLGRLAAGFAHELRNPLGIVRAYVEELERGLIAGESRDDAAQACREIVEEVDRMNGLVSRFLDFSRAGRDAAPAHDTAAAPLPETVRAVMAMLEPKAQACRVALVPPTAPIANLLVRLDVDPLRQVIVNLLMNAIEASPPGGRVWTEVRAVGGTAELRVCDQGPGVPPDERARIFEPFYTTRPGGTGLGLAICRQIAEAAGGTIAATDGPDGRGACFVLRLPRVRG